MLCIAAMSCMARGLSGEAEPVLIDALSSGEAYFSAQSYGSSALLGMIVYEKGDFGGAEKLWTQAMSRKRLVRLMVVARRFRCETILCGRCIFHRVLR